MSVAKENVFWSIIVKLDRPEMGFLQTISEFDETSFVGTVSSNIARFIFLEFFESVCGPGKLKCTFKSNIECFIF